MLLKFAYRDFSDDRVFKNTTKSNIKNDKILLGKFIEYCIENEVFTDGQIRQMLNYYRRAKQREKRDFSYRDYIIIVILITGIRRGEIIKMMTRELLVA